MRNKLFSGGIHPAGKKDMTAQQKVECGFQPKQVILPMRQHIGTACEPLVSVGDSVTMGQKIGDGEGLCVPVHASVSGRVVAVEERPYPGGGMVLSVVIENDGRDRVADGPKAVSGGKALEREEILKRIREGGVVGMGGAAFPTGVKAGLEDVTSTPIDTLIINACECEPYITADDALLIREPKRVLEGAMILAQVLEPMYIVLAVEDNKAAAITALRAVLPDFPKIHLEILPTRYPQGGEKQLIYAVTGREVPSGKLPKNVGCAVFNAATCGAVYDAVVQEIPLIRRIITVTGEGINHPKNMIVPLGTPIRELIEECGGLKNSADKVILGGPMMGTTQETLEVPVVKGTNAVLCLTGNEEVGEGNVCIHCGLCVQVCPVHLQPLYLFQNGEIGDRTALAEFAVMDCIECGCCTYICPAKIPLVYWIRKGKQRVREGKT